mmetsp:Transcript_14384/g.39129  ORF Transcript_14384/g.39129 Transcript_14384/m.39129 type:complete len:205 (-) Transcript_14384:308-922(-)
MSMCWFSRAPSPSSTPTAKRNSSRRARLYTLPKVRARPKRLLGASATLKSLCVHRRAREMGISRRCRVCANLHACFLARKLLPRGGRFRSAAGARPAHRHLPPGSEADLGGTQGQGDGLLPTNVRARRFHTRHSGSLQAPRGGQPLLQGRPGRVALPQDDPGDARCRRADSQVRGASSCRQHSAAHAGVVRWRALPAHLRGHPL